MSYEHTEEVMQDMVRDALARIEEGTYGQCLRCGHVIPKIRLNALPYTPYCVKCELEVEA